MIRSVSALSTLRKMSQSLIKIKQKVRDWYDIVWSDKKRFEIRLYYGNRNHFWVGCDDFWSGVYSTEELLITKDSCLQKADSLKSWIISGGLNANISLGTKDNATYVSIVITP
jgi:hypothetical protein